jgi:hypothetical protein
MNSVLPFVHCRLKCEDTYTFKFLWTWHLCSSGSYAACGGSYLLTFRLGTHWDTGNAAHAGHSSTGFCDTQVWTCEQELRGRAGQHSSMSVPRSVLDSLLMQPMQGRAAQVSVIHAFEHVSRSWKVGQGSTILCLHHAVFWTVYWCSPCRAEQRRFLWSTRLNMSAQAVM